MERIDYMTNKELIELANSNDENPLAKELAKRLSDEILPSNGCTMGMLMGDKLSDFVNNFNCDESGFVEQVTKRTHRTLQQSIFRLMLKTIKAFSELSDYEVDGRNSFTHNKAKEIMSSINDQIGVPMI